MLRAGLAWFARPTRHRPPRGSLNLPSAAAARKPVFATAPYAPDTTGVLRVVLPPRCVYAAPTETCALSIDHYRARKTGPRFPVAVVGCAVHPVGRYTLYPPGHIPYGREAAVPCRAEGPLRQDPTTGQPLWPVTLFAAAVEAADGAWWPAASPADDVHRYRTQGRRLVWAERVLGLDAPVEAAVREQLATRLGVPTLTLLSQGRHGNPTRSWRARGRAVHAVLCAVPRDASLLDRILAAGALRQLWPTPQRWEPGRGTWRRDAFGGPERGAPRRAPSRASPPTNSPAAAPAAGL